ncbi:glycosyltransferase domain protein, partial [Bacteroides fragilis str. 3783N2-1]
MKTQKPVVLYISNYAGFLGANRSLYQLILELKKEEQITPIVLLPC